MYKHSCKTLICKVRTGRPVQEDKPAKNAVYPKVPLLQNGYPNANATHLNQAFHLLVFCGASWW